MSRSMRAVDSVSEYATGNTHHTPHATHDAHATADVCVLSVKTISKE